MGINEGRITGRIVCNHPWFKVMDKGMDAPEVTGGMIDLPQGGQRKSRAAVIGGVYEEGAEAGSRISENAMKIIGSVAPGDIQQLISEGGLDNAAQSIQDYGSGFCTNILKSEVAKAKGEMDNKDEMKAAEEVEEEIHFVFEVENMPTMDEIKQYVVGEVQNAIGGGQQ